MEVKFREKNGLRLKKTDNDSYVIRKYRHREKTHSYLLIGCECSLLTDTKLGNYNIDDEVGKL